MRERVIHNRRRAPDLERRRVPKVNRTFSYLRAIARLQERRVSNDAIERTVQRVRDVIRSET